MYYGRDCDWESDELTLDIVNDGAISTGMVYAQPQKTGTLYNAYQIKLKDRTPTYRQLLFLQQCLQTNIQLKFDYYNKATWDNKVENESISLPLKNGANPQNCKPSDIDWKFMDNFIAELEAERVAELEAYLKASGLDDYELTIEEKELLNYNPKFMSFKLSSTYLMRKKKVKADENGLFDIEPTKRKINANSINFDGQYPYVARGESKNGIRGYIDFDTKYLNPKNTISFGQDTATMYFQPSDYFTGDKIQVFKLNEKYGELKENVAQYLIGTMKKTFANFTWGQQSFSLEAISDLEIELPVDKNNEIDFDYMEKYIQIIKKQIISDVVTYKDKLIKQTKQVIKDETQINTVKDT